MASTTTIEAFSISAAAILAPSNPAQYPAGTADTLLYGVQAGQLTLTVDNIPIQQDDWHQGLWNVLHDVQVQVTNGYISYQALAWISGTAITSSAGAPDNYYAYPLWPQYDANNNPVTIVLRCPDRDNTTSPGTLDLVLYQVQLYGVEFTGPSYKSGLGITYSGRAVPSWYDDTGSLLSDRTIGRLIAHATQLTTFTQLSQIYHLQASDSARGTETGNPSHATLSSADTAKGSPETQRLTVTNVTSSDSASGSDSANPGPQSQDSATGADSAARYTLYAGTTALSGSATISAARMYVIQGKPSPKALHGYGLLTAIHW